MLITFLSQSELEGWLVSKNIDISRWAHDQAKSVNDLWKEICAGECKFEDNPPLRLVGVVRLIIKNKGNILIETQQQLRDGRMRPRYRPPSEKMKNGETWLDTAERCIHEELCSYKESVNIFKDTLAYSTEENDSQSYPGLRSKYSYHDVEANIPSLPISDFTTTEINKNNTTIVHYWSWTPESEALLLF